MTDLKSALKDILPLLTLHSKSRSKKWAIDRPVEFRQCPCGEMVDQRIVDVICITSPDEYNIELSKRFNTFHEMHNDNEVQAYCSKAKPCPRCFRWSVIKKEFGWCYMCRHNPNTVMPAPMIAKRPWYVAPRGA